MLTMSAHWQQHSNPHGPPPSYHQQQQPPDMYSTGGSAFSVPPQGPPHGSYHGGAAGNNNGDSNYAMHPYGSNNGRSYSPPPPHSSRMQGPPQQQRHAPIQYSGSYQQPYHQPPPPQQQQQRLSQAYSYDERSSGMSYASSHNSLSQMPSNGFYRPPSFPNVPSRSSTITPMSFMMEYHRNHAGGGNNNNSISSNNYAPFDSRTPSPDIPIPPNAFKQQRQHHSAPPKIKNPTPTRLSASEAGPLRESRRLNLLRESFEEREDNNNNIMTHGHPFHALDPHQQQKLYFAESQQQQRHMQQQRPHFHSHNNMMIHDAYQHQHHAQHQHHHPRHHVSHLLEMHPQQLSSNTQAPSNNNSNPTKPAVSVSDATLLLGLRTLSPAGTVTSMDTLTMMDTNTDQSTIATDNCTVTTIDTTLPQRQHNSTDGSAAPPQPMLPIPKNYPRRLALKDDDAQLNPLHCFIRRNLLEVFIVEPKKNAAASASNVPPTPNSSSAGRVGLRCVHCAVARVKTDPNGTNEAPTAVFYPRSIGEIYRLVTSWQRCHLRKCRNLPPSVRAEWTTLRDAEKIRGRTSYWVDSAKQIGLVDCMSKAGGIRFCLPEEEENEVVVEEEVSAEAMTTPAAETPCTAE